MPPKMLTLHSDGTPNGTILLTEDGATVDRVTEVDLHIDRDSLMEMRVTMLMNPVIAEGELKGAEIICPGCETGFHHECNPQVFGGPPGGFTATAVATVPPTTSPSFIECGRVNGIYKCRMNVAGYHATHVDTEHGYAWTDGVQVNLMLSAGSMATKL